MNIKSSESFAEGHYAGIQLISDYLYDRWKNLIEPIMLNAQTVHRDGCISSLYLRALAWIQTLERMNNPVCIQAVISTNRSLLEIGVDLLLLHNDKTNKSGWKMHWWGQSEKLKNAEETINFYTNKGLPLPDVFEPRQQFFDREKDGINHLRKSLWPSRSGQPRHPRRWTDNDLIEDIKAVDELYGHFIKDDLGVTFEELYCTEFRNMSWYVHSGVASVYNILPESYHLSFGRSVLQCTDLGLLCLKIVLTDLGLTDHLPNLREEWDQIKEHRAKIFFEIQTYVLDKR